MSRRTGEDRRRSLAHLAGLDAERIALLLLVAKGYWPMARRYLGHRGEIDMILKRGRTIVAVEVKARATLDAAAEAVTPAKIRRISAAMRQFRAEQRLDDRYTYRCDAVLVAPRRLPRHIADVGPLE